MNAIISEDSIYRYWLTRPGILPPLVFCGVNPSTADADYDDATIRKMMGFAKGRAIVVVNTCAFRATDPEDMKAAADPVGPDNDHYLAAVMANYGEMVCCWGTNASQGRVEAIIRAAKASNCKLLCLGTNKDGSPRHPLYLRSDTPFEEWNPFVWEWHQLLKRRNYVEGP